jgi:hypothetical protein
MAKLASVSYSYPPVFHRFEGVHTFVDICHLLVGVGEQAGLPPTPDLEEEHNSRCEDGHLYIDRRISVAVNIL